jgi:NhaA family Na+:H+ antiporter
MITPRRIAAPAAEFARYLRTETVGGVILLAAAAVALIWANSPWGASYEAVRSFTIGPSALHLDLTVAEWATDGLLAVFFFVVGLELKRELVIGELATRRQALLPVAAALGGMVVPAGIALLVGRGAPGMEQAWAIPVATDIAFALGVLALAGAALPSSARVFLLGLAVVDDLGAIVLIAVLFSAGLNLLALAAVAVLACAYWWLQRRRVTTPWVYVPIAVATWIALHEAGVHATIAGVLLGVLTRVRADEGEDEAPALRMEHRLQPWTAGVCVPLFALFAAGVPIGADAVRSVVAEPVGQAVIAGLLVGKVIGIFGASYLTVRLTPACRPSGLGWRDVLAVSMLGGVGFTVSLLLAELSLDGAAVGTAKAAVLLASALAALLAAAVLAGRNRTHRRRVPRANSAAGEPREGSYPEIMRARDLAQDLPTVGPDSEALAAARLIATHRLPGVAVVDTDGRPVAVLPASQVLRFVVPGYIQEDPRLARVLDEASADLCADGLAGKRVRDLLPPKDHRVELAAVAGDATVVECAAVMARLRSPLVVVTDGGHVRGLLTAAHLLEVLLSGPDQPASTK